MDDIHPLRKHEGRALPCERERLAHGPLNRLVSACLSSPFDYTSVRLRRRNFHHPSAHERIYEWDSQSFWDGGVSALISVESLSVFAKIDRVAGVRVVLQLRALHNLCSGNFFPFPRNEKDGISPVVLGRTLPLGTIELDGIIASRNCVFAERSVVGKASLYFLCLFTLFSVVAIRDQIFDTNMYLNKFPSNDII